MLDPEMTLYQRAVDVFARGAGDAAAVATRKQQLLGAVTSFVDGVHHYTYYGVLPLALTLLVLHENTAALAEGRPMRFWNLGVRVLATFAGLLAYGKMCGLLVSVAGGGGGWMQDDDFVRVANASMTMMSAHLEEATRMGVREMAGALIQFMLLLFVWGISMAAALFAWVANILLAKSQAILLVIFVALGKTCISVSLVPGVGLWRSWARGLAQTAAWSTVAAVITIGGATGDYESIPQHLAGKNFVGLFMAAGYWVVLGVFTLAVPKITGAIFSGASPGAVGVLAAMGGIMTGLKAGVATVQSLGKGAAAGVGGAAKAYGEGVDKGAGGGDGPAEVAGGLRPHKVDAPAKPVPGLEGRALAGLLGLVLNPVARAVGHGAGAVRAATTPAAGGGGERGGMPLLRKGGLDHIDRAGGFKTDKASAQPAPPSAENGNEGNAMDAGTHRANWEAARPPEADGPEVSALAQQARVAPHEAAAQVVGQWAQNGYASARNVGELEMTSARVWDHVGQSAGRFGGGSARAFTQAVATKAHAAHRAAAQRLGAPLPADATPMMAFAARHPDAAAPAPAPAGAGERAPAVSQNGTATPGAAAPDLSSGATERTYPLDAVTPLALRLQDQKPHQISPHVIRRAKTVEQPAALRGEEDANG